jgi:uncharacterized protein YjiK
MKLIYSFLTPILLLGIGACSQAETSESAAPPDTDFILPYRLDAPDTVFQLPGSLREISGLTCSSDGRHLLAVNDEQGFIFQLNIKTGAIEAKQDFGKHNDYEGLAAVGKDVYVVNSSGTVYHTKANGKTKSYPTPLNSNFDVEGLCYDSSQNRLLLACKGQSGKGAGFTNKKAIYAFDLSKKKLSDTPAFLINRAEIARWKGGAGSLTAKINEFFSTDLAPSAFGPSGLAFSPIDGNLYVVASVGKALAVLRPDGSLALVQPMSGSQFKQPEGICFDHQGRLYISSEGKNGVPGRIFRFATIPH